MKKFRIGVRIHDIFQAKNCIFAERLEETAVDTIQLTMPKFFPGFDFNENDFSAAIAEKIRFQLLKSATDVSVLSCYINPVKSQNVQREKEIFKKFIDYAEILNIKTVGTETGTVVDNLEKNFIENHSDEVFNLLVCNMKELNNYAAEKNIKIGIECVSYYPVHSAKTLKKFMKAVGEDNISVILDPVNLLNTVNYRKQKEIMYDFLKMHHAKISVVHLKDFALENGRLSHIPLFEGGFEIDYFLQLLKLFNVECDVILENANAENLSGIIKRLKQKINYIFNEQNILTQSGQISVI